MAGGIGIVLINGLWMTALSWEHRIKQYADKGYRVIARNWPAEEIAHSLKSLSLKT
jgi:hypothetical protein